MKKLNIYCDMDGVLADFNAEINAVERFKKEKGFFKRLKPFERNVRALRKLILNKNVNVYILSASPNARADKDKIKWLKKYMPFIKKENIIKSMITQTIELIELTILILIIWLIYTKIQESMFGN